MVACDLHPAAMEKGMGSFMNQVDYIMCHLQHIMLKQQGGSYQRTTIKSYVQTEITFATDIRTNQANDAYMSLTCHFTTSRQDMVTCVLATPPLPENHTVGVQTLNQQGMSFTKISLIVRVTVVLKLCIQESLHITIISEALIAAKKLMINFQHSSLATATLRRTQETMSVKPKKLQQTCITGGTVHCMHMIQSLLQN